MTQPLLNNRYRLLQALGSGGFGETFLAEDTQMPSGRRCVIKQLKPITNNPQIYQLVQERFQREAVMLEQLGEENKQIPTLYAYFAINGQFYLVQEWIEGETLTNKLKHQGLLSESTVRDILINLLPVLDYVHSKGIIHRDIKPDNIIVRQRDSKPTLIDFGAVKETMGTLINSQGNTTSSIVIGTPGFMPSEQAAGRPIYSSDLYSLGLTAIYLLTGQLPQAFNLDPNTGEILWRPHALSVSATLAAVLDKAIQSHPRDRYHSAREMLEALQSAFTPMPPTIPVRKLPAPTALTNQESGQKAILASLIVGGLIGASIIFGFVIARNPQSELQKSVAEKTVISPNPSLTGQSVQTPIINTPKSSPPTSSPPPAIPNIPSPTAANVIPKTSQTSPKQAVQNQYSSINSRQYQSAWNKLSKSLQNNKTIFPNGYISYINFWQTVNEIEAQQVTLLEKSNEKAIVEVRLKYSMRTGKIVFERQRLLLVWDKETNRHLQKLSKPL